VSDILGRVADILRANVNDMLDGAEDPVKMVDQLIRDYTSNIQEAEQAVAQTVGNLRLAEDDLARAREEAAEWGSKAAAAAQRASQAQAAGNSADVGRFDDLAKTALRQQISYENQAKALADQVAQQTALTSQLKEGLNGMRAKLTELQTKRDELMARAKMAEAQRQVQESVRNISIMDPTSDLARYEERIRSEEAMARGMAEVSAASLEGQFQELEESGVDAEVEARLAALKGEPGTATTASTVEDPQG
jgi:phage shock protein A